MIVDTEYLVGGARSGDLRILQISVQWNSDRTWNPNFEIPPFVNPRDVVYTPYDVTHFYNRQPPSMPPLTEDGSDSPTFRTDHTSTASPSQSSYANQTSTYSPPDSFCTGPQSKFLCLYSGCEKFFNSQANLK